jgi:hypothetical protein
MKGEIPGEIPQEQWGGIAAVRYSGEDMTRVMDLLSEPGQGPWVQMLGATGVQCATQVNMYNFTENMGNPGEQFDVKKHEAGWLGPEAMCMRENGFPSTSA